MRSRTPTHLAAAFATLALLSAPPRSTAWAGLPEDLGIASAPPSDATAAPTPAPPPIEIVGADRTPAPGTLDQARALVAPTERMLGLATTPLSVLQSDVAGRRLGVSVAPAGDVNGDGFSDVVALGVQFNGPASLYLFFGGPAGITLAPGFPYAALPYFPSMVTGVGDLDGNGLADVAMGFPGGVGGGTFKVFFGRNGTLDMANPFNVTRTDWDGYGEVVAPAGDLNGDGVDDLVVGSPLADNLPFYCGIGNSGKVDVFFGAAGTGPSVANFWTVNGCLYTGNGSRFGAAVGTAGDVNGDGVDDLIISAPEALSGGVPNNAAGRVFVVFGSTGGLPMDPVRAGQGSLAGASAINSFQDFSSFGAAAVAAGDVNGDGFADVAIGSPDEDWGGIDAGFVRVFAGSAGGLTTTLLYQGAAGGNYRRLGARLAPAGDVNGDGRADLLVGQSGQVDMAKSYGGTLGYDPFRVVTTGSEVAFATAGDVNGDGLSDVVVGDPMIAGPELNEGQVSLFTGRGEGPSLASNWEFKTMLTGAELGASVASAGDVNGDGLDDFLTGAPHLPNIASPGELDNGGVFLHLGRLTGPTPGLSDWGYVGFAGEQVGTDVASAGDVNGDGVSDIIVGAPQANNTGEALIFFGQRNGLPHTTPDQILPGFSDLSRFGAKVASGDFNGDGYADVAVGAPMAEVEDFPSPLFEAGRAFVYLGGPGGVDPYYPSFTIDGSQEGEHLGSALVADADLNGDGYTDLVVSAPDYDQAPPFITDSGRLLEFHGNPWSPLSLARVLEAQDRRAGLAYAMSSAGDVNGDGYADIVVGMPRANGTGLAEVFAGGSTGLSDIPLWTHDGFQAGSNFGSAVACAGDVNGDGLSDVLVGAMLHDVGGTNNGGAMLFLGPLPAGAPTAWFTASPLDNAQFGAALANAGDTNGDGWSDIVVGSPKYSADLSRQGHVDLYLGATGIGRLRYTRPTRTAGSVALRGSVDAHSFGFASIGTSAAGRTQLKLQARIELPPFFPGPPRDEVQPAFTPTGGPGTFGSFAFLVQSVGALGTGAPFSWRSRALTRSLYFPTTTWAMPVRNGPREYDLRTPGSWVGAPDEVVQAREFALAPPWPNPTRSVSHVAFELPRPGRVRLEVLDLQGRVVGRVIDEVRRAGRHEAAWDGRLIDGTRRAAAGVYFYRLEAGGRRFSQKFVMLD